MVLCMDEKSQVQALDRTQPSLPMKKGRAGTMTHDYKRNGSLGTSRSIVRRNSRSEDRWISPSERQSSPWARIGRRQ